MNACFSIPTVGQVVIQPDAFDRLPRNDPRRSHSMRPAPPFRCFRRSLRAPRTQLRQGPQSGEVVGGQPLCKGGQIAARWHIPGALVRIPLCAQRLDAFAFGVAGLQVGLGQGRWAPTSAVVCLGWCKRTYRARSCCGRERIEPEAPYCQSRSRGWRGLEADQLGDLRSAGRGRRQWIGVRFPPGHRVGKHHTAAGPLVQARRLHSALVALVHYTPAVGSAAKTAAVLRWQDDPTVYPYHRGHCLRLNWTQFGTALHDTRARFVTLSVSKQLGVLVKWRPKEVRDQRIGIPLFCRTSPSKRNARADNSSLASVRKFAYPTHPVDTARRFQEKINSSSCERDVD